MDTALSVARPAPRLGARPRLATVARGARRFRRALSPLSVVALWWASTTFGWIDHRQLAGPEAVLRVFVSEFHTGVLQANVLISVERVAQGLALGVLAGVAAGCVSGTLRFGEDAIDPLVQMLRTVPVIALTSLFIVWFGIQELPKIVLVAVAVFFPIYLNTHNGIRNVDARLVEAAQGFGVGRLGLIWEVVLPGALPQALLGLRVALGVSWLVLVFAEQINAQAGVGYLLTMAQANLDTAGIMAGIVTYATLGILTDLAVRLAESRLLGWRRNFTGA